MVAQTYIRNPRFAINTNAETAKGLAFRLNEPFDLVLTGAFWPGPQDAAQ